MCIYIYIYIYTERERERDRYVCVYIYIYIYTHISVHVAACQKWAKAFYFKGAATRHRCLIPSFTPCSSLFPIPSGGA